MTKKKAVAVAAPTIKKVVPKTSALKKVADEKPVFPNEVKHPLGHVIKKNSDVLILYTKDDKRVAGYATESQVDLNREFPLPTIKKGGIYYSDLQHNPVADVVAFYPLKDIEFKFDKAE